MKPQVAQLRSDENDSVFRFPNISSAYPLLSFFNNSSQIQIEHILNAENPCFNPYCVRTRSANILWRLKSYRSCTESETCTLVRKVHMTSNFNRIPYTLLPGDAAYKIRSTVLGSFGVFCFSANGKTITKVGVQMSIADTTCTTNDLSVLSM